MLHCCRFPRQAVVLACLFTRFSAGINIDINSAMIAITTKSSINVKPIRLYIMKSVSCSCQSLTRCTRLVLCLVRFCIFCVISFVFCLSLKLYIKILCVTIGKSLELRCITNIACTVLIFRSYQEKSYTTASWSLWGCHSFNLCITQGIIKATCVILYPTCQLWN